MSDIKLFRLNGDSITQLGAQWMALEKSLQTLIERHLDVFLGIRFLASEYATGQTHGGRIDTLGIDENGCPVILEYKRSINQNVINQGLFYLDWLLDHKDSFKILVLEKLGKDVARNIEWSSPRLLCIAGDFTKYDKHAIKQMDRNIELIRYRRYGKELLLFELVNVVEANAASTETQEHRKLSPHSKKVRSNQDRLTKSDSELTDLYESLKHFLLGLGDDVQAKHLKYYIAFRRMKNFACVNIRPQKHSIVIYTNVIKPKNIKLEEGFTSDLTNTGHPPGRLEITIHNADDFEKAKPLLVKCYEGS